MRGKGPERKLLTTMFVDIVSSSALVAGRDPEDADEILLSILNTLVDVVPRYDGMVSQLLGDGFMAVFGAPDAQEDHALRACLAAQDIVRATVDSDLPAFQVRIGISSGDVVAHVVESGVWADYRMVGECVHAAAKLQQRADPNTAQFSCDTLDLIPVGVVARPVGSLTLAKGAVPIPAFTLEGARAVRRTATDMLRSSDAPFVGREAEVATLLSMADMAEAGSPALLVLRGEAGIGKSRLVGEFFRDPRSRRWNVVPWPQMPIRRLGDPDDLEAVALSLAVQTAGTASGDGPLRVAAAAARRGGSLAADAVRDLFGLPPEDALWPGLDPSQKLSLAIDGLVGAVLELASPDVADSRPMLLLVEDAHWARPVMARLLNALAAALPGSRARILLLATMRPPALRLESAPEGWSVPKGARRIDLDTLDNGQVQRFLNHWLGPDWSLADLKTQVTERSQGIPLYLEEILRTLEATGAISGTPGGYRLANAAAVRNLPRSLHGLLAARIDLMDTEPRRLLMNAAVVGPTFDAGLLRALSAVSESALPVQLAYLERAGFILRARLLPNLEYAFNHALVREVAYATLTKADRRILHSRVLQAIRQRREHDLPNRIDLMAHHAFMAENWPYAYACGWRAGRRAEERSKLASASEKYGTAINALAHLPTSPRGIGRMIRLSIALPRVLLPQGATNIHDMIDRAKALSVHHGDWRGHADATSMLASFTWAYGKLDEAIALCEEGLSVLPAAGSRRSRVQLLVRLGGVLADKGLFGKACRILEEGAGLLGADPRHERYGLAASAEVTIRSVTSRSLAEMARPQDAVAQGSAAVELAERSGHIFSRIFAYSHFGWALLLLGQPEQAMSALSEARALCRATKSSLWLPLVTAGIGHCLARLGRVDEGMALFEDSYDAFRRQGNAVHPLYPRVSVPQVRIWDAESRLLAGDPAGALATAQDALRDATATGQLAYQARALLAIAMALRAAGAESSGCADALARATDLARTLDMPRLVEDCRSLGRPRLHSLRVR
ncbi:class 3 adenylate cyclase/tetratricopeptide (TPR) repeat protein [Azospirillum agricola]|uniref:ATP-binding protein n=1 Tax=Azospirillum agricola TaxID=1720247 RepID=UPI001AEA2F3F|nr:adenylate/guanylate cyclase domain-containing protein [Azospirillum agricola]MBP2230559.1 class 3 adenylate cyclase/tetratricopeptide (TPR) repeat protein [Azospirillum agricola]